jgi:hypothetical protein
VDEALGNGEAPTAAEGRSDSGQASQFAPAVQATDLPSPMAHGEMSTALGKGDAVLLGPELGWVARYEGSWWTECEHGWLRVTDEHVVRDLDQVAARLAEMGAVSQGRASAARPEGQDGSGESRSDTLHLT